MEEKYVSIKAFIEEVKTHLSNFKNVKFIQESYIETDGKIKIIDSAIIRNNETLAIFEFKPGAKEIKSQDFYEALPQLNISFKFLILSTGFIHKVLDRYSDEVSVFNTTKSLLDFIFNIPATKETAKQTEDIAETIEKVVLDFLDNFNLTSHPLNKLKTKLANHFSKEKILKNIRFNKDGQFFHLSSDIRDLKNFENTFFRLLTEEMKENEFIYRYTTLDTVFSTVKYTSVRLNGIVGMNDISEVGYVESYLDDGFVPMESIEDVEQINNRFILCSSVLSDDLMQWRLYGDDCKGACLKFKVKKTSLLSGLQLRKISYGIEVNGRNYHPELDLISKIIKAVKDENKQSIQFRALGIWKHFFKSFEYTPEQEVRLLLIVSKNKSIKGEQLAEQQLHSLNKDWCLTTSHQIVNPFITISLSDATLPFDLAEVILGPKCPEVITNKKQFEQLLREKLLGNVTTKFSRIKNYR